MTTISQATDAGKAPIHRALYKEMDELHSYSRAHMQYFLSWFSFYAGLNMVALGWMASAESPKRLIAGAIAANFVLQGILAIGVSRVFHGSVIKTDRRITKILAQIDLSGGAQSALPKEFYQRTVSLVRWACAFLSALWLAIFVGIITSDILAAKP